MSETRSPDESRRFSGPGTNGYETPRAPKSLLLGLSPTLLVVSRLETCHNTGEYGLSTVSSATPFGHGRVVRPPLDGPSPVGRLGLLEPGLTLRPEGPLVCLVDRQPVPWVSRRPRLLMIFVEPPLYVPFGLRVKPHKRM